MKNTYNGSVRKRIIDGERCSLEKGNDTEENEIGRHRLKEETMEER